MVTELDILRTVRHRHILNCLELFESRNVIWVVMEIIKGGQLLEGITQQATYAEVRSVALASAPAPDTLPWLTWPRHWTPNRRTHRAR